MQATSEMAAEVECLNPTTKVGPAGRSTTGRTGSAAGGRGSRRSASLTDGPPADPVPFGNQPAADPR